MCVISGKDWRNPSAYLTFFTFRLTEHQGCVIIGPIIVKPFCGPAARLGNKGAPHGPAKGFYTALPACVFISRQGALIYKVKGEGDTIGGTLTCVIKGCPIGLGQPVFGKLHAALGNAMLSINAAKAFEYGEGFKGLKMKGSEQNDVFFNNNGRIETHTNHSGGIQGGISNGQDIYFRVVFKPIATLLMEQETVNIDGVDTTLKARGRHDACVLPRAVPIVEAMAAMTILDYYLLDKTTQL